jgi:hypothetical protein
VIPELLNGTSHGFPKRANKFCAYAQIFRDRAREMSPIEIGPVELRELNAPGSHDNGIRSGILVRGIQFAKCEISKRLESVFSRTFSQGEGVHAWGVDSSGNIAEDDNEMCHHHSVRGLDGAELFR